MPSAPGEAAKDSEEQVGAADDPDVSFHADWATALAMADGSLDPLRAVIDGDLLLHGDPRSLVMARDLLDDVGDLFANC